MNIPQRADFRCWVEKSKVRHGQSRPRLERRWLQQIERLSPKPKQQFTIIDTFIEAEALKQRGSR